MGDNLIIACFRDCGDADICDGHVVIISDLGFDELQRTWNAKTYKPSFYNWLLENKYARPATKSEIVLIVH